ncbi:MAG: UDP-N-acetylmuramoyl-tripeptide--D-alanyl-D-alanine ligase, partial [Gammaproteobacteria bacterium]
YAVIEMGANHPGEIAWLSRLARPTVALITQCAPAHLEGFGSVDGVARAKAEIFSGLDENGTAVVNADDDYAGLWQESARHYRQISFGVKNKADLTASDIQFDPDSGNTRFTLHTPAGAVSVNLPLAGEHNVLNSLAAAACCQALEIPIQRIKTGLERMINVSGRMQMKSTSQGARIFDDTYNANPVSLKAGLQVLSRYPGRKWLILGDMGELGLQAEAFHRQAGEMARTCGIERVYALGDQSRLVAEGFGEGARHFDSPQALLESVKPELARDVTILVKGSRSMAMDGIVDSMMEGS